MSLARNHGDLIDAGVVGVKSILCPVDLSESSATAYMYAQSLATRFRATLVLQHVLYSLRSFAFWNIYPDSYDEIKRRVHEAAEKRLHDFAQHGAQSSVQSECVVQDGSTDLILSLATARSIDLIVMGTHGHSGIDRLFLGSVTEKVLRRARCPVLAIRRPRHHENRETFDSDPRLFQKILLCTDMSESALKAARYAFSISRLYQGELLVVHVIENPDKTLELQGDAERARRQIEVSIPLSMAKLCPFRVLVRTGKPYQQIVRLAEEENVDLAVLGTRGSSLDTAIFGSTAYRVLHLGPCPVLAVHI